jgi:hypothetical protein
VEVVTRADAENTWVYFLAPVAAGRTAQAME